MKIKIQNTVYSNALFQVPEFNFGQFQRWENHEKITYQLEIDLADFIKIIQSFFSEFRASEIEDDDPMDLTELIAYKNLGSPTLAEMLTNHKEILSDLLIFNAYDILHLLFKEQLPKDCSHFYSVNSMNEISFTKTTVVINGICFFVKR